MGNHEYCTGCGQSDYHFGQTCEEAYPEKYEAHQKYLKHVQEQERQQETRVKATCEELQKLGYAAKVGQYGHVVIYRWDLK